MRALLVLVLSLIAAAAAAREPRSTRLFEQWQRADSDRDGALSRSEAQAMPALSPYFDAIDRDGNGRITADEVRAWRAAKRARRSARRPSGLAALFASADTDGNGALSRAEVDALPRLARRFREIDANGDGSLSRAEIDAWTARRRLR